ncbi:TonB-dependent siderophore receptor [Puniceibacterium sediminis]|uniref:Iron complex outermembrane recepter protein n=1 Tax=Puniceibacterium sediminis TaxID=1608407 RepID=A0A238WB21_9RHOB|nr:TonB-dependent siderophore receptor [Puniceibacterium sediminis]SNR43474.1 iron complex outermembrane recepter protein [Puniceibacterium sediminis]
MKTTYNSAAIGKLTLTGILLMSVAPCAMAQTNDEPFELEAIVLQYQEDATGPVNGDPNPPTVTGSKVPLLVSEIPQSVSVLGREDIDRFKSDRVSEALRYTAGVSSDVFGDDNDYDWLRIRGFQADQTGIYLDNAQNLAFAFGSFFIDPYTLGRIEVLRGPSSSLYGGSNPGGIVNYVSKRPGGEVRELTVGLNDATGGWVELDYGDDLGEGRSYRVTGRIEAGDKYDDMNHGVRGTLAPSFKFSTDGGTDVTLLANIHYADEQHNGSTFLPYYGTVKSTSEFGYIDPDANFSDSDWDSYSRKQASVSAIVERELANGFTFTGIGRLGVAHVEESFYYPYGYTGYSTTPVDADGTLSLVAFEHDTLVRTAQTDLRLYGTVDSGAVSHDLLFGLDARYYWVDETQASGFGTNSVVNPSNPGTPVLDAPYQDAITTQKQIGLYFQDQMRFGGGWIATANLRHDLVWTEQDGSGAFARDDSETSYRVAVAYETAGGMTPYASFSSFFNPLITSPSSGVTEPETGHQVELGVKWAPQGSNFSLAAAAFQIRQENVLTGAWPTFAQLGEVRSRGFEVEGQYDFGNGLSMKGAATFLDVEVTKDSNEALIGNAPTMNPGKEISLFANYAFAGELDGLSLGLGARHRGESYADAANTLRVPSSTIYDLAASYEFRNGMEGNLSVTNLADERYVTGCQTAYVCSYGSGREISVSITSHF